jgi:glycosyltransferase involved in cell wall biosynthesis
MLENNVAYCSLFRREVWEAVGGYNPNMSVGYEDWDFWVGAVEREFRGHRIPKNLFLYRVRAQSMISSAMQRHRELLSRIVLNHPHSYDEPSRNLAGEFLLANPLPLVRTRAARISVVIPCYKQAQFLTESVASVVAQTCQNWDIIIVNDGSPDDTSAVAARLMQKHPGRISLLEKANGGLSSARNAGIRAAQGEYIFLLDADDYIQPTMLEKTMAVLDTQPRVGFAYTHIQHFGALTNVFPLPDFDRATLIFKDNIVCGNCLVRKAAWLQAGGYNEAMREGYEDWDFWIGCVERGWEGFRIAEPLFCYRKSAKSMLSDANQKRERLIATIVSNHPGLYNAQTRAWADDVLRKAAAQAASASRNAQSLASLRVTYLISSILGVTGGNQTLLRQADELQRRGHDVTIVTYTPKPDWFTFKMRVVQVAAGQAMAPHVPPSDVVISTYFMNAHELLAVKAAVKVYYAQGDQFVFADTTLADSPENRRWRELSRDSYLLPEVRFVPNSHNLARAVENMTGRKPDGLLPVCTDQTLFRPLQRSLPGSRVRILIVGPDVRGSSAEPLLFKGIQDIRDALLLVAKRHPNFTAVRMSGSPPEIFQRFPCEFYVAPSDEMKTVLFGTADILIYASHYDSCPRPPQEAMASGCAVVCTATPGAMEYCRDGENCLLVPIQSPQAIADATLRLIEDRALRERLVQGGLATARKYPRELEWNELETMLRRFVGEAKNASTPATTSRALQPTQ